ncbi:MAG TPA: hypothetical protein VF469_31135 [Kofleriaceae bacterium]
MLVDREREAVGQLERLEFGVVAHVGGAAPQGKGTAFLPTVGCVRDNHPLGARTP